MMQSADTDVVEGWIVDRYDRFPFKVFSNAEVHELIRMAITDVRLILPIIPKSSIRALLHHYKWNVVDLVMAFRNHKHELDESGFYREAQTQSPGMIVQHPNRKEPRENQPMEQCKNCYRDFEFWNIIGIECGHRFCKLCWYKYATRQVLKFGKAMLECLKCNMIIDEPTARFLLQQEYAQSCYDLLLFNSRVERNPLMRWCAGRTCNKIVAVQSVQPQKVLCTCLTSMCYGCGEFWHEPLDCRQLQLWLKGGQPSIDDWFYLLSFTCPYCSCKSGKKMAYKEFQCSNPQCCIRFCTLCANILPINSIHDCPNFKGKDPTLRFDHFNLRFHFHYATLMMERWIRPDCALPSDHPLHLTKAEFEQRDVYNLLRTCRQFILFGFALRYLLNDSPEAICFDTLIADLEAQTDNLTKKLHEYECSNAYYTFVNYHEQFKESYQYCEKSLSKITNYAKYKLNAHSNLSAESREFLNNYDCEALWYERRTKNCKRLT